MVCTVLAWPELGARCDTLPAETEVCQAACWWRSVNGSLYRANMQATNQRRAAVLSVAIGY